ncbi:hypothetical protein AJ80_07464 [Polytolypa hystricis UAMH7299]|uniref:WW-domain-binding protein n=1 Tax=Polytolypa hystricis (strain UAMH7299) TaxID=1447883 RepID=A0A2B7XP85_POLH7|nr:hypothetical protein AJ80_07464 [Polytolypa hystricis UAMH7299]
MSSPKPQKKGLLNRLRPHSWVMLDEATGFVRLPQEKILYTSPPRTTLSLQSLNTRAGDDTLSIQSSSGCVHLTNQRIVYLPIQPTPEFQSFSAPILNLHDTHVAAPFFGPNIWTALLQPVAGGGIPPSHSAVQLKMTFKDGGAFDFHSCFERIKERLQQAVETARESGLMSGDGSQTGTGRGAGAFGSVNFSQVHLEELPAYEGPGHQAIPTTSPTFPTAAEEKQASSNGEENSSTDNAPPTEPPPGYEEVQQQSVANELEDLLRQGR